jgi:hypothetical protein
MEIYGREVHITKQHCHCLTVDIVVVVRSVSERIVGFELLFVSFENQCC